MDGKITKRDDPSFSEHSTNIHMQTHAHRHE
jgi:hypothetical protein